MKTNILLKKTRSTLLYTSLLNEFFIPFFGLMPFILRKELFASAFQISLFTMLKPAVAVFSFYWGCRIIQEKKSLRNSLVISGILARLPFLFFIFFNSIWYVIFASAMYMLFSRASIPAWMEILKLNLQEDQRQKLFSLSSILAYAEGVLIAFFIGRFLDNYSFGWKGMLVFSSILGLFGIFLQYKTPIFLQNDLFIKKENLEKKFSLKKIFIPWKDGILLLKERKDFFRFQLGTMLNGFGFMLAIPAFFLFYADFLKLSHMQMIIGRYIFMGLGFVCFSFLWARAMQKFSINYLTGYVCIGFGIFPIFIMLSFYNRIWLFIAFLSYGITQAGSRLIWYLSGATFAKDENSAKFTSVNILAVGIRGVIGPLLGGVLCEYIGPINVFFISISFCFLGSFVMFKKRLFAFDF